MNMFIIFLCMAMPDMYAACNGHPELCNRRYNEIAYAATHNAHSHIESEVHNQDVPIQEQLKRGIRALKIHVWFDLDAAGNQNLFVCHGIDKKLLYDMPVSKMMDQVPLIYKPFARALFEKLQPMKEIALPAFEAAYGKDNATGLIPFPHCLVDPARQLLKTMLLDIHEFLEKNPTDVVTLIVEDHTAQIDRIVQNFTEAGLSKYLHTQDRNAAWPTLRDMIDKNQRLVVFYHPEKPVETLKYPWMHYVWDFAYDTSWEFKTASDFKNEQIPARGLDVFKRKNASPDNTVFIVHHFLTEMSGGTKKGAKQVNKKTVLRPRLAKLAQETGKIPNIIQLDFFQYPNNDIFDIVDELNGVGKYKGNCFINK